MNNFKLTKKEIKAIKQNHLVKSVRQTKDFCFIKLPHGIALRLGIYDRKIKAHYCAHQEMPEGAWHRTCLGPDKWNLEKAYLEGEYFLCALIFLKYVTGLIDDFLPPDEEPN